MMHRLRSILSFLCFFLFFLAANTWVSGQADVSRSPSQDSLSPRIAVDSAGNIHVVWGEYTPSTTNGDAYYSKYDINSKVWSVPINLSNNGRVYTEEKRPVGIAIDPSDNIYVIYVEKNRISMRIFSGGSWGSPIIIHSWSSGSCDTARVAVDSSGNIFTCWWTMDSYAVHSRARIGGNWEAAKVISVGQSKFPDIAVGNGVAFATWTTRDPDPGSSSYGIYQIFYTRRSKSSGASWSTPQKMYQGSVKQQVPAIEIDGNDIAHIVFTPVVVEGGIRKVRHCRWTGNGFTAPEDVSTTELLHYPALAERGNNLYACWQVGAYGNGSGVQTNRRINGTWMGIGAVPNSAGVTYCDVDTSPDQGTVYYVWDGDGEVWCNMGATGPPPPPPPPPTGNPVASFSCTPNSGSAPLPVSFDGTSSYDSDGTIVSYSWNFGDGGTGSGSITSHTYTASGVFTAWLTVTDNDGKQGSTSRTVDVTRVNEPPVADFGFPSATYICPVEITFDASASRDPDGSIVSYSWTFGDGGRASGKVVKHTYTRWGTFSVTLSVRDDAGATASKVRTVTINRLFQPLSISWQTHADESLFQTRYVTQVTWERNPANDAFGVQIVMYRVYRKKTGESDTFYKVISEESGETYSYLDKDGGKDLYVYTVTARDNLGHESPIVSGQATSVNLEKLRNVLNVVERGKISEKL
ncbi:MAG: PKD domain-containing protein [Acidobacteriota bacterium]